MNKFFVPILALLLIAASADAAVVVKPDASPRVRYGAARLTQALSNAKIPETSIVVTTTSVGSTDRTPAKKPEGFELRKEADGSIQILGNDDSGALYGCLELARQIRDARALPTNLNLADAPQMKLRGTCIGMQKTYILPGRHVYEYPYTPDLFPFFYDKAFWQEYLDFLADNRMNALFLWNGHPFSSLVRLPDYPYAVEVPPEVFEKNVEMYRYIVTEADKRGIWVVQMFYNLLLSKPFAEKNNLQTQLKAPTPLAADYTRKSLAAFVAQYPNVGLMVCLGEALQGQENQTHWLTDVILPGIKDGMKTAGLTHEPPVIIRTHATDLRQSMPQALEVYKNLYTEAKFNGESLTTWEPRGKRQQVHLAMSQLGSTHLINIHILANLEPFRYGAQRFIKKSVQAGRDRLGASGVHLYPLFYWNWPDSPDMTDPPLKQWDRDWIWFEAWGRYSWNPDIPDAEDRKYWINRLSARYGSDDAAASILGAYNDSGECAPRILRRFGITEGNRQTMSLGMTLDELVDPDRYGAFTELWESQSPPGERLGEYVLREFRHEAHEGETPPQIIREVLEYSQKAVDEVEAASKQVASNQAEFERLRNDVHCIRAMSQNYAAKANAAICVLRYAHSHDLADMEKAESYLAESLEHFRTLTKLTEKTYRFANSMQTSQRKIPVPGGKDGKPANYHWSQLLPIYEKELADFRQQLSSLKANPAAASSTITALPSAPVEFPDKAVETYTLERGAKAFSDRDAEIELIAPELQGLKGVRIPFDRYKPITFEAREPVQVLLGYFQSDDKQFLQSPKLETDARADEHGGSEPILRNAAKLKSLPPVNVHVMNFPKGRHTLDVHGSGAFLLLGMVPQSAKITPRDAGLDK